MKLPDEPMDRYIYRASTGEQFVPKDYADKLRSLCEQLKEDAERYRWLREHRVKFSKDFGVYEITIDAGQLREHWDAAIDAARKESDDKG